MITGPVLSALHRLQRAVTGARAGASDLGASVFIVGYWRSGTTLLHELMGLDSRYAFPTTYDCLNPHHFILTRPTYPAADGAQAKRPMDDMVIRADSPQEDEFALLGLGARSPYEAFLAPGRLGEALRLADPRDLPDDEMKRWRALFLEFLHGVCLTGGGRPLIIKSPTHGYRLATIAELVPQARFVVMVRDPYTVFESTVRLWRTMGETYGFGPVLPDDDIRRILLVDRPRFEARLAEGLAGIDDRRRARLRYEDLVADPVRAVEGLYDQLGIGDFETVRGALAAEAARRGRYMPRGEQPSQAWIRQIGAHWRDIIDHYGYPLRR